MKKIFMSIFMVCCLFLLYSCKPTPKISDFEVYNELFFRSFVNARQSNIESVEINNVTAYYYDTYYYYNIQYYQDEKPYDLLYIYRYMSLSIFFSIASEED